MGRGQRGILAIAIVATLLAGVAPSGAATIAQDDGGATGIAEITFSAFACPPLETPDATPVPTDCTEPLPGATLTPRREVTVLAGEENAAAVEVVPTAAFFRVNHPRAEALTLACLRPDGEPVDADPDARGLFVYPYDEEFHPGGIRDGDTLACTASVALAEDLGAGGAILTVHNRTCPAGFPGPDYYGACHDTPTVNDPFSLASLDGATLRRGSTEATGDLTFAALPPGAYELDGGLPGDFGSVVAFCARTETPAVQFPSTTERLTGGPGAYRTTIDLAAGDDITCDVYAIPADLS